jgi:hypothetical protein
VAGNGNQAHHAQAPFPDPTTRTAGFTPPNWYFRGFGFCPFRERVSSRQPPVTRAVGPRRLAYVLYEIEYLC